MSMFWYYSPVLEAPYQTSLSFLPNCGEDQSMVVTTICVNPECRCKQQEWWSSSKDQAPQCLLPICVPLPRCCFRDPPQFKVMKTNLLFAFHPWLCGCSFVLPCPACSHRQWIFTKMLLPLYPFRISNASVISHQIILFLGWIVTIYYCFYGEFLHSLLSTFWNFSTSNIFLWRWENQPCTQ